MDARILAAAHEVVAEHGAGGLSLDRVAAAAGLSKGGLMHHVRRKHDLLEALVDQFGSVFDQEFNERGADTKAYIDSTFASVPDDSARSAASGFLAVVADDPSALEPLRARYREWQDALNQAATDPVTALMVRLACDGLWLAELLDLAAPDPATRAALHDRLLSMTVSQDP